MRWSSPPRERRGGIAPRDIPGGSFFLTVVFRARLARGRDDRATMIRGRASASTSPRARCARRDVRLSMPCCEILSSTRSSSSARDSTRRGAGDAATTRLAIVALLFATTSSTSSPRSRRGGFLGMARGGSSASGIFATRCRTWSMLGDVDAMRMYTYAANTPPRCAKYARFVPAPARRRSALPSPATPITTLNTSRPTTSERARTGKTNRNMTSSSGHCIAYAVMTPNTAADAPTSVRSGRTAAGTRRRRGRTGDRTRRTAATSAARPAPRCRPLRLGRRLDEATGPSPLPLDARPEQVQRVHVHQERSQARRARTCT